MPEIKFEDIKGAKLGQAFSKMDLLNSVKAVYGGISWPGKRPGFAVVIAMDPQRHFDSYDICLLDEFESPYTRKLVRQCGALDFKYSPKMWIGDWQNDAAFSFIQAMNREREKRQQFNLIPTPILDMENLYPYILGELKRLLDKDRRQLFLKNSKIKNYLNNIEDEEIPTLKLGDYPAIESIAFAALEMRSHFSRKSRGTTTRKQDDRACAYNIYELWEAKDSFNEMDF